MAIETTTNLVFTETKNGGSNAKTYELRASEFIRIVHTKETEGGLDIGVEPILDEEGEVVDFTPNKFFDLSLEEQLDLCCRREGERYASTVTYAIVAA